MPAFEEFIIGVIAGFGVVFSTFVIVFVITQPVAGSGAARGPGTSNGLCNYKHNDKRAKHDPEPGDDADDKLLKSGHRPRGCARAGGRVGVLALNALSVCGS